MKRIAMTTGIALRSTCATDAGQVRASNQDTIESREPSTPFERAYKGTVWALADGFGPQDRALHASRLAARVLVDNYWNSAISDPGQRLRQAAERANTLLHSLNEPGIDYARMSGATILAAAIVGERLFLINAGKSRAYRIRRNQIERLTTDHTWVAAELEAGRLTPAEAANHPRRNVVTRALGFQERLEVDLFVHDLVPGDTLMLCTDGLTRELSDTEIVANLSLPNQDDPAKALIDAANSHGGSDNISVIVLRTDAAGPDPEATVERLSILQSAGRSLGRSLDLDETIDEVMQELLALLGGEHAAVILCDERGEPVVEDARQFIVSHDGRIQQVSDGFIFSSTIVRRVVSSGQPEIIGDALSDPQYASQSVVGLSLRSILCVPLLARERTIGALYLDSSIQTGTFTRDDLDLLVAFAGQAAAAIENARLYKATADQAESLRRIQAHQRSIIRSMSSALIAVDGAGRITTWNPVASELFEVADGNPEGRTLGEVLPASVSSWLQALMGQAWQDNATMSVGHDWQGSIGNRERVYLTARVAILRPVEIDTPGEGFVITVNDRTAMVLLEEARQAETARRRQISDLFGRYMAPRIVDQILQSPDTVRLGGTRQEVTILFADIRGFTAISEHRAPEEIVSILNRYLALATAEILAELGTLDKFLGDGLMAIFNAPVWVQDHEMAAVRAALAMQRALASMPGHFPAEVGYGIGIHTGEAIVGNIGTPELMNYTAIGDAVNVAARLQSEAQLGEVLISGSTYQRLPGCFEVEMLGERVVKGRTQPVPIYRVLGMRP
jgi:adenylate cyclase